VKIAFAFCAVSHLFHLMQGGHGNTCEYSDYGYYNQELNEGKSFAGKGFTKGEFFWLGLHCSYSL
jgi:hypothetical protein